MDADSVKAETAHTHLESTPNGSSQDDLETGYKLSWRTFMAVFALSISWAATSFAVVGPNSAIQYMIADYPDQAGNATWIASSAFLCVVTLPPAYGSTSDRYGKKWIILIGALVAMAGALVSGTANSVNTIIGGQALNAIGGVAVALSVPAGMEVVPAKYRVIVIAMMAVINGVLGVNGGVVVFAACVETGLSWRWGFKIMACNYAVAFILIASFYHPPPTRFRREMNSKSLLSSIDFIGIILLAGGGAMIAIPLIWGGSIYPWNSAHVIPFLVIGPLLLVAFGLYEWKGRKDGIMHHGFFETLTFPVFITFGFVDGLLLYGTSVFLPNQIRALYTTKPLGVALYLTAFNGCLLAGFMIFGFLSSRTKQFRWPLVGASLLLTVVCGLLARAEPSNLPYFEGMIALLGILTASTEVLPVAGIGLVVPSSLIATSNTVLGTIRGLGGVISVAVFTAVYNGKANEYVPQQVVPLLTGAGIPPSQYARIFGLLMNAPKLLAETPGMTPDLYAAIIGATQLAEAEAFKFIWYCFMACAAACMILSFFIVDVPNKMTDEVESALEPSKVREKQQERV